MLRVRPGWLVQAVEAAQAAPDSPFLLRIDEINRGDLAKVLGEAIYLFEPGEQRAVDLAHPLVGGGPLRLPNNLFVLGTMNTADGSIASLDLAIRRRFAFVTLHPDRAVVAAQPRLELATQAFDRLAKAFVEYAPDDAFALLDVAPRRPGPRAHLPVEDAILRAGQEALGWVADDRGLGSVAEPDFGEDEREAHRADIPQALAYASLFDAESVTTAQVDPLRPQTWRHLAAAGRTVLGGDVATGGRGVRLALVGMPFGWEAGDPRWRGWESLLAS